MGTSVHDSVNKSWTYCKRSLLIPAPALTVKPFPLRRSLNPAPACNISYACYTAQPELPVSAVPTSATMPRPRPLRVGLALRAAALLSIAVAAPMPKRPECAACSFSAPSACATEFCFRGSCINGGLGFSDSFARCFKTPSPPLLNECDACGARNATGCATDACIWGICVVPGIEMEASRNRCRRRKFLDPDVRTMYGSKLVRHRLLPPGQVPRWRVGALEVRRALRSANCGR